ncbi:LysR family transcriptional regulator [Alteromonas sp. 345S023]|uniref:LysR family transcriptional regulator n=1 Tax=Alteromonas profundi TaxID=2696062 RepID=A0A7X5RLD5_9ALTE|nr:LysR family transcriptional regulator [Alteromonas profundi]NDV91832.1 LysR family transcriptional regulator [Alteromonas profundi]
MLISDLEVVLKVAEFKSIKKAADSLDMITATASAAVIRVEKAFGVALFQRTTRQLKLSSAGEKHIPQIEQAVLLLSQIKQSSKNDLGLVEGEIRLAVPSDLGRNFVLGWLDDFIDMYPKVTLKLHISDSNIDFYREPVDVALRYGAPADSRLYGFKICDVPRVACASPNYIARYGTPKQPNELLSHNALLYELHDIVHNVWEFQSSTEDNIKVKVKGDRATNDAELVRRWCVAGKGIAVKSALDMSRDLLANRLVQLLPEYPPKTGELWLICPSRQLITPAIRKLREHLIENCHHVLDQLNDIGIKP